MSRRRPSESLSGRVNQVVERYASLLEGERIELTEKESLVLSGCLMGSVVDPLLIRHLVDELDDSEFADNPDPEFYSLRDKLQSANYAQLLATVEHLNF